MCKKTEGKQLGFIRKRSENKSAALWVSSRVRERVSSLCILDVLYLA